MPDSANKLSCYCNYLLKVSVLILLAVFILLLIIEFIVFQVFDIKNPGYRPDRFFQFDTLTGWFMKPNSKGYWYRYIDGSKFFISINSYGFADSQRDIQKKRPRIVLIGDSTIQFWETEEKYRGQYIIEQLLNYRYEVFNFGVRAYGTDQSYLLFKNVGVYFQPDIAIYNFCINDIFENSSLNSKPYFALDKHSPYGLRLEGYPIKHKPSVRKFSIHQFLIEHSYIYRNVYPRCDWARKYFLRSQLQSDIDSRFDLRPYKKQYSEEDKKRMEITLRLISLLDSLTRSHGVKLLVVEGVYRPAMDTGNQRFLVNEYGDIFDFDKVSNTLEDYCARNNIAFFSLQREIKRSQTVVRTLMHREDVVHLNKQGIQFYAQAVVNKLYSLGWVTNE